MKKDITTTVPTSICDFCEHDQVANHQCLGCGKDICREHTLTTEFQIAGGQRKPGFSAYFCPICSQMFKPVLVAISLSKGSWAQIGYNPEFNHARLKEILAFIKEAQEIAPYASAI